jgi:hypothetical protein
MEEFESARVFCAGVLKGGGHKGFWVKGVDGVNVKKSVVDTRPPSFVLAMQTRAAALAPLLVALLVGADQEVDCSAMKTKQLRQWLAARGLSCSGCAEKSDFVNMCEANKAAPLVESKPPEPELKDDKSIEDLLASMKGIPGMEGIKMFTADDLKNMDPEQMGSAFGGGRGKARKRSRSEWKKDLVDFYTRYDLPDKIDGIDAALDKWKGRESKMMDALYKKYDDVIREKSGVEKEEL